MTKFDLTAGGRLTVSPHVSERKVLRLAEIVEGLKLGGHAGDRAALDFKEALTTSDAPYSFAHLINVRNLPLYDEAERTWDKIAATETLDDFRPASFYSLRANFDNLKHGNGTDGNPVAPEVPELGTYVEAYGYTEEQVQVAVGKRGFKWFTSLERVVNDPSRTFRRIPSDMLQIGLNTDEFVVYKALVDGATSDSQIEGGTDLITGDTVAPNPTISAAAIRVALKNIGARVDNRGNKIPLASSYYVVVPSGTEEDVEWMLDEARRIISITDNEVTYGAPGSGGLRRIAGVIGSEYIPDESWYLVPAAGTTLRPSLVHVNLRGYTAPEVYVQGAPVPVAGGASSDPFRAFSWDDDRMGFKFRQFTNGALITQDQLAWSDGSESS